MYYIGTLQNDVNNSLLSVTAAHTPPGLISLNLKLEDKSKCDQDIFPSISFASLGAVVEPQWSQVYVTFELMSHSCISLVTFPKLKITCEVWRNGSNCETHHLAKTIKTVNLQTHKHANLRQKLKQASQ